MPALSAGTLVHPDSLGDTLDAVNAALFTGQKITKTARAEAAAWIADRQGLPGSYAGMFAPTEFDYAFGMLTFTGEAVVSAAGTGHVLSEEACGVLYRLGAPAAEAREAIKRARKNLFHRMEQAEVDGQWSGVFCCGTCSVALWRHLLTSAEPDDQRRLEHGLTELRRYRDDKGRWKRFPFYYTLLALTEINHPAALEEARYAATVIERALRRLLRADPETWTVHEQRRKIVMERILEKC